MENFSPHKTRPNSSTKKNALPKFLGISAISAALAACNNSYPEIAIPINPGSGGGGGESGHKFDHHPNVKVPQENGNLELSVHPPNKCTDDKTAIKNHKGTEVEKCDKDELCAIIKETAKCVKACEIYKNVPGQTGCEVEIPIRPAFLHNKIPTDPKQILEGVCYAIGIANSWSAVGNVEMQYDGKILSKESMRVVKGSDPVGWPVMESLQPGEMAMAFINSTPDNTVYPCPVAPALNDHLEIFGSGVGKNLQIKTSVPMNFVSVMPFGAAASFLPSAAEILPKTNLAKDFFVYTAPWGVEPNPIINPDQTGSMLLNVTNPNDKAADVNVYPSVDLQGLNGAQVIAKKTVNNFKIPAHSYLQLQVATPGTELNGTLVNSTLPVEIFAGATYERINSLTTIDGGGESEHYPVWPVNTLGHKYAVNPPLSRMKDGSFESTPYRVVAFVDGTQVSLLTKDSIQSDLSRTMAQNSVWDFEAKGPISISSQDPEHPIGVLQILPGCILKNLPVSEWDNYCTGDEEVVGLTPLEQSVTGTVPFMIDPTYDKRAINVTRIDVGAGFKELKFGWNCKNEPVPTWLSAPGNDKVQVTTIDLTNCEAGGVTATSDGLFQLYVWEYADFASIGYSAAGAGKPLNHVTPKIPPIK